jgi:hypothetical protein
MRHTDNTHEVFDQDTHPISNSLITRRQAVGFIGAGILSAATLTLGGCDIIPGIGRVQLAERLLKEKYNREFKVLRKAYGFNTSSQPLAECRASAGVDIDALKSLHTENGWIINEEAFDLGIIP